MGRVPENSLVSGMRRAAHTLAQAPVALAHAPIRVSKALAHAPGKLAHKASTWVQGAQARAANLAHAEGWRGVASGSRQPARPSRPEPSQAQLGQMGFRNPQEYRASLVSAQRTLGQERENEGFAWLTTVTRPNCAPATCSPLAMPRVT